MTPATRTDRARFEAALAFERAMHAAVGRVVTAEWGQAFLHPEIGRCHEENVLWAVADAAGLDAGGLDAHAGRLLGGAGLDHRRIVVEGGTADALWDDLVALGYEPARHLYLAHEGPPPPEPGAPVVEIPVADLLPAEDRYLATDPDTLYARDDEVRAHIVEHHRTYGSAGARERIFAVVEDGEVAAWCKLWSAGGTRQVEDVVCLAEHRGRGWGRAVTAAATRAALAEDPDLLFIVADADDWPRELYGRLGFRPVGSVGVFVRLEPGHPATPGRAARAAGGPRRGTRA